jgi:hypothetical protein
VEKYIDLERVNRQMIAECQALLAERDKLKGLLQQRSLNVAVEAVEGLGLIVGKAAEGDPNCKALLKLLMDALEQARMVNSGLVVVKAN